MYYSISSKGELYTFKFYGFLEMKILEQALEAIVELKSEKTLTRVLLDFSKIEGSAIMEMNLQFLVTHEISCPGQVNSPIKLAFHYEDANSVFFLMRYKNELDSKLSEVEVEIFKTRRNAQKWLALPSERKKNAS